MHVPFLLLLAFAVAQDVSPALQLDTVAKKASYGLGLQLGAQYGNLDLAILKRGIEDAIAGRKPALSDADIRKAVTNLKRDWGKRQGELNRKKGEAFLKANKEKEGVIALPSGLQYKIRSRGDGKSPGATDLVTVHYHGTLIDGSVFDSSVERKSPATFPLNRVIKGWSEGLQLMKVGGKWTFTIPADLAYGDRSPSPRIPPGATLVFEVELLSIKGK